jgi:hypothetical protein
MKKINTLLHNEKVQGNLIIFGIFAVIVAVSIITWGK